MSKIPADRRLGRLLAIVPWVAHRDGPRIEEVCNRFDCTERELLADLELLFFCGVHPFTPDTLIDVDIADGRVWIRFAEWFSRPLRLTPPEGLALLAAGVVLAAVPGGDPDGTLAAGLAKLATVLGLVEDALDVDLGPVVPGVLEAVQAAASSGHKLLVDYYSFGRDGRSTRVVAPWRVFNSHSQWYVGGFCDQAGGERLFRVDRMASAVALDETFERPRSLPVSSIYRGNPRDPLVVLDLAPAAQWIAEQYPLEEVVERPDGVLRVTLRVSETAWLQRLLLRAGADATVIDGDVGPALSAAMALIERYEN